MANLEIKFLHLTNAGKGKFFFFSNFIMHLVRRGRGERWGRQNCGLMRIKRRKKLCAQQQQEEKKIKKKRRKNSSPPVRFSSPPPSTFSIPYPGNQSKKKSFSFRFLFGSFLLLLLIPPTTTTTNSSKSERREKRRV